MGCLDILFYPVYVVICGWTYLTGPYGPWGVAIFDNGEVCMTSNVCDLCGETYYPTERGTRRHFRKCPDG